jgi:5-methyltetrahydropteroyltriglutamate--homocysteine methyltransferase
LGVIDLSNHAVESPELVASRIARALPFVDPHNLLVAPDCGMKYLPREAAFGKLQAMVAGAQLARRQLSQREGEVLRG